jgi:hypothetical protein
MAPPASRSTARAPHERVGVYADWTADLKGEACDVYKVRMVF